jgi:hypothetical protein
MNNQTLLLFCFSSYIIFLDSIRELVNVQHDKRNLRMCSRRFFQSRFNNFTSTRPSLDLFFSFLLLLHVLTYSAQKSTMTVLSDLVSSSTLSSVPVTMFSPEKRGWATLNGRITFFIWSTCIL